MQRTAATPLLGGRGLPEKAQSFRRVSPVPPLPLSQSVSRLYQMANLMSKYDTYRFLVRDLSAEERLADLRGDALTNLHVIKGIAIVVQKSLQWVEQWTIAREYSYTLNILWCF